VPILTVTAMWSHKEAVRRRKSAWKAMVLAEFFGGVGFFYVGFQPGVLAVAAWCVAMPLATWLITGWVRPINVFGVAFLVTNALFIWPALRMVKRHNSTVPADLKVESDGFQRVRNVGNLVIVLSIFTMVEGLFAAASATMGDFGWFMHVFGVVLLPMSAWGLATGIGLLRSWRWARISMLVFSALLAACGTLGVVVGLFFMPNGSTSGWELILLKTFFVSLYVIPAGIGVRWFMYFRRDNVRAHFHTSRTDQTASA
jgi:hypothetical protein